MAISDNFVFSDPALQGQVVNAAQVRAAADAARAQQFAETLRALRQERQLNAEREERRAERDRVIREGEARSAENKRQFDESLKFNREALAANKETTAGREKKVETKEDYNNMLRLLDVRNDASTLPTVKELESRMAGLDLTDKQKQSLREERQRSYDTHKRNAKLIGDEVAGLNALVGQTDKATGKTYTLDSLLKGSQFKNSIAIDRAGGRLKPLISLPRDDEAEPTPTFHVPVGRPPQDTYGTSEPISAVQQRIQPGFWSGLGRELMNPSTYIHPGMVPEFIGNLIGSQPPLGRSIADQAPTSMFIPQNSVLDQAPVLAPRQPVLDASLPEYRYDMPPMFIAPQY